eukprot:CAMPEP_0113318986 /NCGR_PEP_ID=MMETSP0010_2-20120614/13354_1 /TAXON_ID=216773 ORGANISM="Corethron hystrix, Strain 308" /NCGR_SAMPLE_ID=MMETSP0010_2 /ASSEMBLY_ACC=CAM_ASM_000155 /LENGTH=599 /DNA_ID=CAMNT_0000176435 /DNA_START=261 /DNA_END=2060 /DNA_ORIENTATION=- /assembly_acc=CAM_ASM_000155
MSFREIDEARQHARLKLPLEKKRKAGSNQESSSITQETRNGRWTNEETLYVQELMKNFENGSLPLKNGTKLSTFLADMLQCKHSRLTKKMKNAKLSMRSFRRTTGFVANVKAFSQLEDNFFRSIVNDFVRAEVKFNMQKEWREYFCSFCAEINQPIEASDWLSSVEEIERRGSLAKDAAKHARRKLMMGYGGQSDGQVQEPKEKPSILGNSAQAISQPPSSGMQPTPNTSGDQDHEFVSLFTDKSLFQDNNDETGKKHAVSVLSAHGWNKMSPFLDKVLEYIRTNNTPFEYVEIWAPVRSGDQSDLRVCFAGHVVNPILLETGHTEEFNNLVSFGNYSQKFSFFPGSGLPGRIFQTHTPTWDQSIHNAPRQHFERCTGAQVWGIKTAVGVPVLSQTVGVIVVALFTCNDIERDSDLVDVLSRDFTNMMPSPKWKLIVDVEYPANGTNEVTSTTAPPNFSELDETRKTQEVVSLLGEIMPADSASPVASYLPVFMSLRLLMLQQNRSNAENDFVKTILGSYAAYKSGGRTQQEVAVLIATDYSFLMQRSMQKQNSSVASRLQSSQHLQQQLVTNNPFQQLTTGSGLLLNAHNHPTLAGQM